ncbi:MAG: hypothetical protein QOG52_2572, partial [Frankiaceae bacterium]|nr:hypothetical protein [Frankiaceae bacterium]
MTLDDRLKDAFTARAATATASPEAWEAISSRTRNSRRTRWLHAAAIAVAVPALAVGGVLLVVHDTHRSNEPTVTVTPTPTGPTPASSSPSATRGSYAGVIAVVRSGTAPSENRPGDSVQLVGTHGEVLSTVVSLPGIQHIAWTPDRKQVYVASFPAGP